MQLQENIEKLSRNENGSLIPDENITNKFYINLELKIVPEKRKIIKFDRVFLTTPNSHTPTIALSICPEGTPILPADETPIPDQQMNNLNHVTMQSLKDSYQELQRYQEIHVL